VWLLTVPDNDIIEVESGWLSKRATVLNSHADRRKIPVQTSEHPIIVRELCPIQTVAIIHKVSNTIYQPGNIYSLSGVA